jgi:imidazolonepropionase-like amidohydrolase
VLVNDGRSGQGTLIVTNATVFDGESAELVDGPVAVRDGRIVSVGDTADLGDDAVVVDAEGGTVLPGLIDRRGVELGMAAVSRAKNREVLDAGRQALELAVAAGVPVGFGTDLMGELEEEQLNGLRLQSEVLGILDTLRCATSVNARLLGLEDLGVVRPGAIADLLVVSGNPLEQPECLWDPAAQRVVIQGGRVV